MNKEQIEKTREVRARKKKQKAEQRQERKKENKTYWQNLRKSIALKIECFFRCGHDFVNRFPADEDDEYLFLRCTICRREKIRKNPKW